MADISMCLGRECSEKEQCYRFKASVSPYWQSYAGYDDMRKDEPVRSVYFYQGLLHPAKERPGEINGNSTILAVLNYCDII